MIRHYQISIKSITPLLMHMDSVEWSNTMDRWKNDPANKKNSKAGDDRTPAFRWLGNVYNDGKSICISAENIAACLIQSGAMVPVPGGKGGKTFKSQTMSGMQIVDRYVPLRLGANGAVVPWSSLSALMDEPDFEKHCEACKRLGFELFVKRARIGTAKHIRVRPKFDDWQAEIAVDVWDEQITEDVLRTLFEYGGRYKGIGDWRPSSGKPGPYGMFQVASLSVI